MPKDNEVDEKVKPVAWIVTNGGESCEPWLEYEQSEVDALPAVCIAEPLYSAATAPISWASLLFLTPHLIGGGALLWATWRKKCWVRGMSGTAGLVVQGLGGGLFFLVAAFVITRDSLETLKCRRLQGTSEVQTITGPLTIDKRFQKPGYGYIQFNINGKNLHTYTQGLNCDCGYIQPVGRVATLVESQVVRAQVAGKVVLSLERIE